MQTQRINDIRVKPVRIPRVDPKLVRGSDMFQELYANIFICAKKKSGKSTVIENILKKCVDKTTNIVIFSATVNKDATYKKIVSDFEKKGNTVITYTSIKDENGIDNLNTIVELLREPEEEDDEEDDEGEEENPILIFEEKKKKRKKRKPKKPKLVSPEVIFVLDDLSTELRFPSVSMLLKSNRHYKSKVIMSSQYANDLHPSSLMQLDYFLVFGGHTVEKLEMLHQRTDLSVSFNKFMEMYKTATEKKFSFLYVDTVNEVYRKNFNERFLQ